MKNRSRHSLILFGTLLSSLLGGAWLSCIHGAAAADNAPRLSRLIVDPQDIILAGARASQHLQVTGEYSDGSHRDLGERCRFESSRPDVVAVTPTGVLQPQTDGTARITVRCDGQHGTTNVTIQRHTDASYTFTRDVLPVLSRLGCNQMGCHGSPKGKAGVQLSLFGAEPAADFGMITRSGMGRLITPLAPETSLLLLKATGAVSHGGGPRLSPGSPEYRLLADWVGHGAPRGSDEGRKLVRVAVFPRERVLPREGQQPLLVEAYYADGSMCDATRLAGYTSTDELIATVSRDGMVAAAGTGEAVVLASFGGQTAVSRLAIPQSPAAPFPLFPVQNRIDELVLAKLRKLNIVPSPLTTDTEFLRRVYLDVLGILPTPDEVRAFVSDARPDKRTRLIDAVLARPEFVDMWTLKWDDLLRVNAGFPINLRKEGMLAYHQWVCSSIEQNKPMNQFVHELLTAQGSGFEVGPANFFRVARDAQGMAEQAATLFLGIRLDCAHCHNHPFEQITWDDNYGMAAFFAGVKFKRTKVKDEEIVQLADKATIRHVGTGQVVKPRFLCELEHGLPPDMGNDPREQLAAWVTSPENPWFARSMANRVWFWLLGRGIVHEPDDFRSTNPPSNPELLDYLADEFNRSGTDMKHVFRLILNSRTYQLSSKPNASNTNDAVHFSHYRIKRLAAEQMLDAICQATGVPERYPNLPLGTRAAQVPDAGAKAFFLDLFGRPKRALVCECERSAETHVGQSLQLINSELLEGKLSAPDGRVAQLFKAGKSDSDLVDELYLSTLGRFPTAKERATALSHLKPPTPRRERAQDLLWTLLNTKEFLFNH